MIKKYQTFLLNYKGALLNFSRLQRDRFGLKRLKAMPFFTQHGSVLQ